MKCQNATRPTVFNRYSRKIHVKLMKKRGSEEEMVEGVGVWGGGKMVKKSVVSRTTNRRGEASGNLSEEF
jgi:hypothetical protein